MTDLVQILDPHITRGTSGNQQDADRFDITIRGLRDPRRPTRQRRTRRFDRIELVGLPVAATLLAVRTIDLDHHQALTAQMTRQPRPVRAGPFDPHPDERTETGEPTMQLAEPGRGRRER